jgi:hypothetical protein
MNTQRHLASPSPPQTALLLRTAGSTLCLSFLGLAITATPAFAQNQTQSSNDRYQVERANCYNGRSNEDGATCLKEANAALAEDRKGKLSVPGTPYQKNATLRCQALPATDKADCERRVHGEGTVSGSVEAGGVLHELVVQTPVTQSMQPNRP